LHITAIGQELRGQRRLDRSKRRAPKDLHAFLSKECDALDSLKTENQPQDHVLLALRGAIDLLFLSDDQAPDALEAIENAMKLGVQSHKLAGLFEKHSKRVKEIQTKKRAALDIFDVYLAAGSVPAETRKAFVRSDDLAALY